MASASGRAPSRRRWLQAGAIAYAVLLAASHAVRAGRTPTPPRAPAVALEHVGGGPDAPPVRVAYLDAGPNERSAPGGLPVLLLHGSPGDKGNFAPLVEHLAAERRALAPDLPGFGESERDVADYSARAHAAYVSELLSALDVPRAHVVGFSLGGVVALELQAAAPERVASITLLSATGVQELELLGDAHLNRALHGLQLAGLWAAHELVPHFGLFDGGMLSVAYARNFFDTDQRPARELLRAYEGPMLILHGRGDVLVPFAAAEEHARLVPQSELVALEGDHFLLFRRADELAAPLQRFLDAVEDGDAPVRATASPERVARAATPFDAGDVDPLSGFALAIVLVLAALATLVSEDLTCIGVGALVGDGRLPFWPGVAACFLGIYVGDLLLFLAGRLLGQRALEHRWVRAFLTPERVARSSEWFERRGPVVIFLSRFLPGMRLPTYFASGALRTSFVRFSLWFALAGLLWTPALVWVSSRIGGALSERVELLQEHLALLLVATLAAGFLLVKVVRPLATYRGRRRLVGSWRRLVRWEHWPRWAFYAPVAFACLGFGLRHRRPLAFTAANPGIPHAGFVGESKAAILHALRGAGERVARTLVLPPAESGGDVEARVRAAEAFRRRHGLGQTLVVKPDVGERGRDVRIVRDGRALRSALGALPGAALVQEHLGGEEYGLFWARHPDRDRGRLISIARKVPPSVRGDGERSLERLVLEDSRAVCHAARFLERWRERLDDVPAAGETFRLGELGTHCQGAAFLEGADLRTPELEAAVEEVARGAEGFFFGRFDVRSESDDELRAGRFRILELNGVTSESAHVYDPRYSVLDGWRTMIAQWRLAYAIGAVNAARGARVSTVGELVTALRHGVAAPPRGREVFEVGGAPAVADDGSATA